MGASPTEAWAPMPTLAQAASSATEYRVCPVRLGELRRGETIPWRVIAAQIAQRERRGSYRPDGTRSRLAGTPMRFPRLCALVVQPRLGRVAETHVGQYRTVQSRASVLRPQSSQGRIDIH